MFIARIYARDKTVMNGVIYITEGFKDDEKSLYNEFIKNLKTI